MEMSVRPRQWDPEEWSQTRKSGEGWCRRLLGLSPSNSNLVLAPWVSGPQSGTPQSPGELIKIPVPDPSHSDGVKASSRESSNTRWASIQVLLSLRLEKHSPTCPCAAPRAKKGLSSAMMNSPPVFCIPLATHQTGLWLCLLSPLLTSPRVHPSFIVSFILEHLYWALFWVLDGQAGNCHQGTLSVVLPARPHFCLQLLGKLENLPWPHMLLERWANGKQAGGERNRM